MSLSRSILELLPPGYRVVDMKQFEQSAQLSLRAGLCPDPQVWARKFERNPSVVRQWGLEKVEEEAA